jgi:hypothetical protein
VVLIIVVGPRSKAAGAADAMSSTDPMDDEALFDARRLIAPALQLLGNEILTRTSAFRAPIARR